MSGADWLGARAAEMSQDQGLGKKAKKRQEEVEDKDTSFSGLAKSVCHTLHPGPTCGLKHLWGSPRTCPQGQESQKLRRLTGSLLEGACWCRI